MTTVVRPIGRLIGRLTPPGGSTGVLTSADTPDRTSYVRSDVRPGRAWAYVGVGLGGAVSVAANVAHSYVPPAGAAAGWRPEPGAVFGAVFWPVALFVAIEIMARTAWPVGRRWVLLRFGGLAPVAAVAAVVSYRHLSGLLAWYGEDWVTARFGPLAVDGLMVMATGALIAASGRAREPLVEPAHHGPHEPVGEPPVLTVVSPPGEPAHEPPVSPRPARKVSPAVSPRRRSLTAATVRCDDGCTFPSGCAGTVAPATRKRHRAWRREQGEGET